MDLTWLYIFRKKILLSRWPKLKKKKMLADLNISCCFMTLIVFRSPIFPGFRRTHIMLMTLIPKYLTLSHLVKLVPYQKHRSPKCSGAYGKYTLSNKSFWLATASVHA